MAIQDSDFHRANVIQWRAAQQTKLASIDKQMRGIEEQLRSHRVFLADRTMILFGESRITDPDLQSICRSIADFQETLDNLKAEREAVANEQPPQPEAREMPTLGLKCPVDGAPLRARFCPQHGVEGIPQDAPLPDSTAGTNGTPRIKCPVCGQILSARFCPDHGAEGVPAD